MVAAAAAAVAASALSLALTMKVLGVKNGSRTVKRSKDPWSFNTASTVFDFYKSGRENLSCLCTARKTHPPVYQPAPPHLFRHLLVVSPPDDSSSLLKLPPLHLRIQVPISPHNHGSQEQGDPTELPFSHLCQLWMDSIVGSCVNVFGNEYRLAVGLGLVSPTRRARF